MFKILWHRDRLFDLVVDLKKRTLRFPLVLPEVPANSGMYGEFKKFIASQYSEELPAHRRLDRRKAQVRCVNRNGNVSLTMAVQDRDYEYALRKLIHLVHEIFLVFLGPYFEYQVEVFALDPDRP